MAVRRPLAALVLAVLLTTPAAPATAAADQVADPAACAPPGTLSCLQIASPRSPGKYLDIDNPGDPHAYLRLKPDGGDRSFWRLVADAESVVRVRNLASGNCVDVWRTNNYLDQWECEGQTTQRWHLVPYSLPDNTYRIRQSDTGHCFTRDDADWVYTTACSAGNTQQEWTIGVGGQSPPGVRNLAVKYAMRQCDTRPTTCEWKENLAAKSPAFLGASRCVSQLVHNSSTNQGTYTRTWEQTVGWENTLGGSITLGVETGVSFGIAAKVTAAVEVNYAHSWIGSETVSDSVTVTLLPGEYGWVTRRPLLKKVTGAWTLDVGGQPWRLPSVIKIPAKDGTDQQLSVIDLRTATTPPAGCAG